MYKVIATDLDGTLLNGDHQLDPFTVATVRRLEAEGLHFIIATGRHYRDVAGIRDLLGLNAGEPIPADVPLRLVHDEPFEYDVQRRVPDTDKAKKILGFEATTSLDTMLDEVIPWIDAAIKAGTI